MIYSFLRALLFMSLLAWGSEVSSRAAKVLVAEPLKGSGSNAQEDGPPLMPSDRIRALDLLLEGEDLLEAGDAQGALEKFTEALFLRPHHALLHYARGQALRALDQEKEARQAFKKAVELNPTDEILRKRVIRRLGYESGPVFDPGSLVLFEDVPCAGCQQRLNPESIGIELDFQSPERGVSTLILNPPKDVGWEFALGLEGAFLTAGLKRLGDVYSFRERGALIMLIRLENENDALEIGFRGRKVSWSENPVEISLPMAPYMRPSTDFQSVIIPVSDFPKKGYIRRSRKTHPREGEMPRDTDLWDRRDVPFHWDRVAEIFLRGFEGRYEARKVFIDRWAIVPGYPASKAKRAVQEAREARSKKLNQEGFRIFGDRPSGRSYAVPQPETVGIVDEVVYRTGTASLRAELDPRNWSGIGFQFLDLDLRSLKKSGFLRFFVRGKNGGERFIPILHSRPRGAVRVVSEGPDVRSFVDVSTQWKEVAIPLADFPRNGYSWHESYSFTNPSVFAWDRVTELSFESPPVDEVANTFYLDEIRFSE